MPGTSQSCLEPLRAASLDHRNVPREPPQHVGSVKGLAVCLSHSPSEIWPNIHFVFYPAVSGIRKRKRQANAADPDNETTSPSDSDTSSTVDTLEGDDEKDFIFPDYPSGELTSSDSGKSELEEAPRISARAGQSESPGSTHSSMETTLAPKYPRSHQPREHRTFLPRAVPQR